MKTKTAVDASEVVSALMDGEVKNSSCAQLLDSFSKDPDGFTQTLTRYQIIGDVLRSDLVKPLNNFDLASKVSELIGKE